jgi:hypothetical protein
MLRKREYILVAALLLGAVLATGRVRLRLDDIVAPFRNDFRSMTYLPRGDALKVAAAGFDAPTADALFIRAMVYYPETMRQTAFSDESKLYVYELFDVVTDLSPRFYRAYQTGAMFLTASASLETNLQGLKLLQKGVDVYDRLEAEGLSATVTVDPRWLFHSLIATTQEINIQSRLRAAGDIEGASEARIAAGRHFRLAAAAPDAPAYIIDAARGFESVLQGKGDIEASRAAVLSVWAETYNTAVARGDKELAAELEKRIAAAQQELGAIVATRQLQSFLSQAGGRYLRAKGEPPAGVDALRRAGFLPGFPAVLPAWPLDELSGEKDDFLVLPDGSFKSRVLAKWETQEHLDVMMDSVILYRRFHNDAAPDLDALVRDGLLSAIPRPPLEALGQRYEYGVASGFPRSTHTELFEQRTVE